MENLKNEDASLVVEVTNNVIIDVVERAVFQTEGVWRLSSRFYDEVVEGITEKFGSKRKPGIGIKNTKNGLEVNVYIIVNLSRNFISICNDMQANIYNALQLMLDIKASTINISIEGVHLEIEGEGNE